MNTFGNASGVFDAPFDSGSNFTPADRAATVTGGMSLIGGLLTVLCYWAFPTTRSPTRLLMVYLAVADTLQAIFFVTPFITVCRFQTTFGIFAANTTFFWTVCVAVHITLVSASVSAHIRARCCFLYHIFGWGGPLTIALLTITNIPSELIGNKDSPWCYIDEDGTGDGFPKWRLLSVYGPMWIAWLMSLVFYLTSMCYLHKLYREQQAIASEPSTSSSGAGVLPASLATEARLLYLKFSLIPLSFLLLRTPGTLCRILEYLRHEHQASGLWAVSMAVGDSSQGWVNAIIFVLSSPNLQQSIAQACSRACRCCRERGAAGEGDRGPSIEEGLVFSADGERAGKRPHRAEEWSTYEGGEYFSRSSIGTEDSADGEYLRAWFPSSFRTSGGEAAPAPPNGAQRPLYST